jgi:hypothetical protein
VSRSRHEPLRAWRCWRYGIHTGHLTSTIRSTVWLPRERLTAKCLCGTAGSMRCRHAPDKDCSCGIYAWTAREHLRRLVRIEEGSVPVWGIVSLWGDVIMHEHGVRAQHAYPYALCVSEVHDEHARRIRREYAVDVATVPLPR